MCNQTIRDSLKNNAVYQWQVAERLGIPESSFSRRMRHELEDAEREAVLATIAAIAAERGSCACS